MERVNTAYDTLSSNSSEERSSRVLATSSNDRDLAELALVQRAAKWWHDLLDKFPGKHEKKSHNSWFSRSIPVVASTLCLETGFSISPSAKTLTGFQSSRVSFATKEGRFGRWRYQQCKFDKRKGLNTIERGDYILLVNKRVVYLMNGKEVGEIIRKSGRPLRIRFAKPCDKTRWKSLLMPDGSQSVQKWDDSDVSLRCSSEV